MRMNVVKAGADGWSPWKYPRMNGYKMGCCDCGLVHLVEFNVIKVIKVSAAGRFTGKIMPRENVRIAMRVRRDNRATGQLRRADARRARGTIRSKTL